MCGIVGYLGLELGPEEGRALLQKMCDSVRHRGPDDEGFFNAGPAGLGMRRLSVIDRAGGRQPMSAAEGSLQLVYNGEVYNYRDLRRRLEGRGRRFETSSDTEVVLRQFEESGPSCVKEFNGMFAFALWNGRDRTLFLARDRMGIKPLYYYWDGRTFLFASEIKALVASGLLPRRLNPKALWDYLTFRYVPAPETVWRNVFKLPPGHTLVLQADERKVRLRRYWDIVYDETAEPRDMKDYAEEFEEIFLDSVRRRLVADVPVGVLLSGGLDSSAVAAAVAEVHTSSLSSFTVAFEDSPAIDERPFAREAARRMKADHHEIVIGEEEVRSSLPRLVRSTDEPLADPAAIPLACVAGLAAQHVTVVLSGEGSDEIFGGYDLDVRCRRWDALRRFQRLPRWLREGIIRPLAALTPAARRVFLAKAGTPVERLLQDYPPSMTNYMSSENKRLLWGDGPSFEDSMERVRGEIESSKASEPLHQLLYSYCQSWLVEDLLMKADKMTMSHSLELRVPFLDHRLVSWAARTPTWVKVARRGGKYETKSVLRRFAETRLPPHIVSRPKQGFPVPIYDWLGGRLRDWAVDLLDTPQTALYDWLRPEAVREELRRGTAGRAAPPERHRLWNLLVLEHWFREWRPEA